MLTWAVCMPKGSGDRLDSVMSFLRGNLVFLYICIPVIIIRQGCSVPGSSLRYTRQIHLARFMRYAMDSRIEQCTAARSYAADASLMQVSFWRISCQQCHIH